MEEDDDSEHSSDTLNDWMPPIVRGNIDDENSSRIDPLGDWNQQVTRNDDQEQGTSESGLDILRDWMPQVIRNNGEQNHRSTVSFADDITIPVVRQTEFAVSSVVPSEGYTYNFMLWNQEPTPYTRLINAVHETLFGQGSTQLPYDVLSCGEPNPHGDYFRGVERPAEQPTPAPVHIEVQHEDSAIIVNTSPPTPTRKKTKWNKKRFPKKKGRTVSAITLKYGNWESVRKPLSLNISALFNNN